MLTLSIAVFCTDSGNAFPFHAKIDATPGKQYRLGKQHGPWMIMVASFSDVAKEHRLSEGKGLSAQAAADELVYELRRKGLPAYTFSRDEQMDEVRTTDRQTGQLRHRHFVARKDEIVVLAGNYDISDGRKTAHAGKEVAQKTLKAVKKLWPDVLGEKPRRNPRNGLRTPPGLIQTVNGGLFRATPGRPGPLSGAFLTVNPLLSSEELKKRRRDPLLIHLNSDMEHTLLKNPGRYTLRIATFYGKSATQVATSKLAKLAQKFDGKIGNSLDDAGMNAWGLAENLRNAKSHGYPMDYEAYVYHDRYNSYVTVGSFDSPQDPRIHQLEQLFAAKIKRDPASGREMLSAEVFSIPRNPRPVQPLERSWMFDPSPQLVEVPQLR